MMFFVSIKIKIINIENVQFNKKNITSILKGGKKHNFRFR